MEQNSDLEKTETTLTPKEIKAMEKKAKVDAKAQAKQDKLDAKAQAKQDKLDAKAQAKQDKLDAKAQAKQDKLDAKAQAKQDKLDAKAPIEGVSETESVFNNEPVVGAGESSGIGKSSASGLGKSSSGIGLAKPAAHGGLSKRSESSEAGGISKRTESRPCNGIGQKTVSSESERSSIDRDGSSLKMSIGSHTQGINTGLNTTDNNALTVTIDGDRYNTNPPPIIERPYLALPGTAFDGEMRTLDFSERMLSTHLAMIGGIGAGKSNVFNHIIGQVREKVTEDDIVIIFDTKGDFYKDFGMPGDIVISNDDRACGVDGKDYWNIFKEIDPNDVEGSIRELCSSLFKEAVEHSSNAFFPNAASDILYGAMMLHWKGWKVATGKDPNNEDLIKWLDNTPVEKMYKLFCKYDLQSVANHISDPKSGQTQGVMAELRATLNRVFVGNFAKAGTLSMTQLVKERGGKNVFIEYDIKAGEVLAPIYTLLVDMGLKQALSNTIGRKGSVFLFVDEFKLLPNLQHIDDAVNFGRSLGMKVFIALQAITQMYESYGEMKAKSILSGFLNYFFFNVNNAESREFIKERFGKCLRNITFSKGNHVYEDYVVKDKDITRLRMGDVIVGMQNVEPFMFHFDEWKP